VFGTLHRRGVVCAVGLLLVATAAAAPQESTSAWAGVYTTKQAESGEKIYFERCATCHGDDLAGRERSPALSGPQFLDAWHGKSLRRLFDRVAEMPPGAPVSSADAVDLLAFILATAEIPAGSTALPTDRGRLGEITFERSKP
jgi:mono/diheme cytochrome c family protein